MPTRRRTSVASICGQYRSSSNKTTRPSTRAPGDQVVHAVQGAQERGFAATAGADDGGDGLGRDLQADIRQDFGWEPNQTCKMLDVKRDARFNT
jgi:hypothetical protein